MISNATQMGMILHLVAGKLTCMDFMDLDGFLNGFSIKIHFKTKLDILFPFEKNENGNEMYE